MHAPLLRARRDSAGFTLAELAVIVAMLGCFLMMGVPRLQTLTEQARASEAFVFLSHIAKAQERHRAWCGEYARHLEGPDLEFPLPKWFVIGDGFSVDWERRWSLRLIRREPASGYGGYTVVYNEKGFRQGRSSIPRKLRTN